MPLKWQSLSQDSDSAQQPSVPFGAPEGHFPDQLNNIAREANAAIAEIGSSLFSGTDANGASTATPALSDDFKQLMYDMAHPVNTMILWDSNGGVNPISEHIPSGVTATWLACDGSPGTFNLANKVLGGADPDNASPTYTGEIIAVGNTGSGGAHTPTGTNTGTAITESQMPVHNHGVSDPGHNHSYTSATGANEGSGSGANARNQTGSTTGSKATGISINNAGSGNTHTHTWTGDAVAAHTHTAGLPARTLVEIYKRTA
jgi:hypothetical protein